MARKKSADPTSMPPSSSASPSGGRERESAVHLAEETTSVRATDPGLSGAAPIRATEPNLGAVTPSVPPIEAALPAAWLERLLELAIDPPFAQGEEAVVRAVVDVAAELLPTCAVGACFVRGQDLRQRVIRKHPRDGAWRDQGIDPTRLFPGYLREAIVAVPGAAPGSTLHAACDDASLLAPPGAPARLLDRIARLLGSMMAQARAHDTMHGKRREIDTLTAQMVQAEKLASLGQIAAGMVHELNNPLTSIVAYADFLMKRWAAKRDAVEGDELERLRRIGESAHRLLRFTRDLVSYARPSGETPIPVVLHGVIDQALVFCEHLVSESRVRIERRFGDGILPVRGLPEQLTQVFVNLVTNACHAMPSGGGGIAIYTELVDAERTVRIRVEDTGHGIAAHHVPRVFDPFFTTKSDGRGNGLGLSIVKSIVEGHGGRIWVENVVESESTRGARFVFVLPVASR